MKEKFPCWYSISAREIAESIKDYGYCFPERYECFDEELPGKKYYGWKIYTDEKIVDGRKCRRSVGIFHSRVEVYHQGACYWLSCEFADLDKEDIKKEMKRLGWSKEQGIKHLMETYGKKNRIHLTDEQLLEFWSYLKQECLE